MKLKITSIITLLLIVAGSVGMKDYTEPEKRVIVTALAIDSEDGELLFTAEANVPDGEGKSQTKVYSATSDSPEIALKELESASYGKLLLSQCPVILIGSEIPSEKLRELIFYLFDHNDIALSVKFVYCQSAYELLDSEEKTTPSGYEIEKLLNNNARLYGKADTESFAEIIDKAMRKQLKFSLPFIEKKDERFVFSGTFLFENFSAVEKEDK